MSDDTKVALAVIGVIVLFALGFGIAILLFWMGWHDSGCASAAGRG